MSKTPIKFFGHDVDTTNDLKIIKLLAKHGNRGYGIWWRLVELLYKSSNFKLPADYELLGNYFAEPHELIRSIVEDFELFAIEDNTFYSKSATARAKKMKKKIDNAKKAVKARWDKEKESKTAQPPPVLPFNSSNNRAEQRLKEVYGEEIEQEAIRNKVEKYDL